MCYSIMLHDSSSTTAAVRPEARKRWNRGPWSWTTLIEPRSQESCCCSTHRPDLQDRAAEPWPRSSRSCCWTLTQIHSLEESSARASVGHPAPSQREEGKVNRYIISWKWIRLTVNIRSYHWFSQTEKKRKKISGWLTIYTWQHLEKKGKKEGKKIAAKRRK